MPSIPECRQAANGYFYVYWSEGGRSQRLTMGTREASEARKRFSAWLVAKDEQFEPATGLTVADLWRTYTEKHVVTKTVSARTIQVAWMRLEPFFGRMMPAQVTQEQIETYERDRCSGKLGGRAVSPGSVRRELMYLKACLNWCAGPRRKIIAKADVPSFDLPAAPLPRDRWLSIPEVQRLLDSAAQRRTDGKLTTGERFLWLALETAARRTAIQELTWDRVDFEAGVIHYNVPGRKLTKKRRASPPMSSALRKVLERAYRERTSNLVIGPQHNVFGVIQRIAARAGVPGVAPHVLRHTAATQMARRGVPIAVIADVLGNTVSVCDRVYRHHCPDATRKAVEHISAGLLDAAE